MSTGTVSPVHVVGGGLAGSEAAWQIANVGVPVALHEMRPACPTEAHVGGGLAELVCSNSFRSDDPESRAVGILHAEMRRCNSLIMWAADTNRVPAGAALAVDRERFNQAVEATLSAHLRVRIVHEENLALPGTPGGPERDSTIVASGPLTSAALAEIDVWLEGTAHAA